MNRSGSDNLWNNKAFRHYKDSFQNKKAHNKALSALENTVHKEIGYVCVCVLWSKQKLNLKSLIYNI